MLAILHMSGEPIGAVRVLFKYSLQEFVGEVGGLAYVYKQYTVNVKIDIHFYECLMGISFNTANASSEVFTSVFLGPTPSAEDTMPSSSRSSSNLLATT